MAYYLHPPGVWICVELYFILLPQCNHQSMYKSGLKISCQRCGLSIMERIHVFFSTSYFCNLPYSSTSPFPESDDLTPDDYYYYCYSPISPSALSLYSSISSIRSSPSREESAVT